MSLSEFFHMGGYAVYVWGSYGICLIIMVVNVVIPMITLRETQARLRRRQTQEAAGR